MTYNYSLGAPKANPARTGRPSRPHCCLHHHTGPGARAGALPRPVLSVPPCPRAAVPFARGVAEVRHHTHSCIGFRSVSLSASEEALRQTDTGSQGRV